MYQLSETVWQDPTISTAIQIKSNICAVAQYCLRIWGFVFALKNIIVGFENFSSFI